VKNILLYTPLLPLIINANHEALIKTIEEQEFKNIIFDIGGVLFNYTTQDLSTGFENETFNPFKPIQEMHELVKTLADRKRYKLYILSNWVTKSLNLLQKHYADFLKLFDGIVISEEINVNKPHVEIYQHLIKKYNLNVHESLFIDDQYVNIATAQAIGIKGVEYR
jgi:HAD superfamily hydrolase (TIGR01549 family)